MTHRLLEDELRYWNHEDLANLCHLLGINTSSSVADIVQKFKWLYHSKARAKAASVSTNTINRVLSKVSSKHYETVSDESLRDIPSYDELIDGSCKHVKAYEQGASLPERELHLSQAIIIAALQRMSPKERCDFFDAQIEVEKVVPHAGLKGTSWTGAATTIAMLGAAQASGIGVYMASTTALGFLTHAVGVSLPFAFYTGMTSTIAFIIGPVGWMSAGLWGAWLITEPKWKKMIPALIYIIATNSRMRLASPANAS